MDGSDPLREYREKRTFGSTPEPLEGGSGGDEPLFVIQKHAASTLHYDLRLEAGGVLKSWAVPKGPSMDPRVRRLAVPTEDHPMSYAGFEGVIPEGQYGAGTVMVWDRGTLRSLKEGDEADLERNLEEGHATVWLEGEKLRGGFALIKTGKDESSRWLLIKMRDDEARPGSDVVEEKPASVLTGRSLREIAGREDT